MTPRYAGFAAALALFAVAHGAVAQPAAGVHRIGYLSPGFPPTAADPSPIFAAFRTGLGELGYVEERTITLELRFADGDVERLPRLAAELVRLQPSAIVTSGSMATGAAKRLTATIPIVMSA